MIAGLLDAVRSGETPVEHIVRHSRERIDEFDPRLNAFITLADDAVAEQIARLDERLAQEHTDELTLAGVPVAVKDNIVTGGVLTTCGSRMLDNWTPPYDATVVSKLKAAGAIIMGKTNLDEFGMGSSTEFSSAGVTHNPYHLGRVPGGSSGGSAAAVAAGLVPAALGSDTGGSVRLPASYCGIVGIKPTYGRVSRYGLVAYASSLEQVGTLTRSVEDAAHLLQVIAGHDPHDVTSVDCPVPDFVEAARQQDCTLRVGIVEEMLGERTQPEVAQAVEQAATALSEAGASVRRVRIPSTDVALRAYYIIASAEASSNLARYDGVRFGRRVDGPSVDAMITRSRTCGFGDEVKRRILLGTYALSAGYYDQYYGKAQRVRTLISREFAQALETVDILIGPTAPTTAFGIGELTEDPLELYLMDVCTVMSNLAGLPAASIPWGTDANGLPIGVQLMAGPFQEARLLQAGAALERAGPVFPPPQFWTHEI